jgi:two-component sensor histidine kinase
VVEGPPIQLQSSQAVGLGLILHELTTNAVKYGALSTAEGRLSVRWSIDEEGSLTLRWREEGGPPVAAPTRRGFGSEVLERAAILCGGRLEIAFAPEGVRVTVRLPADPSAWSVG